MKADRNITDNTVGFAFYRHNCNLTITNTKIKNQRIWSIFLNSPDDLTEAKHTWSSAASVCMVLAISTCCFTSFWLGPFRFLVRAVWISLDIACEGDSPQSGWPAKEGRWVMVQSYCAQLYILAEIWYLKVERNITNSIVGFAFYRHYCNPASNTDRLFFQSSAICMRVTWRLRRI